MLVCTARGWRSQFEKEVGRQDAGNFSNACILVESLNSPINIGFRPFTSFHGWFLDVYRSSSFQRMQCKFFSDPLPTPVSLLIHVTTIDTAVLPTLEWQFSLTNTKPFWRFGGHWTDSKTTAYEAASRIALDNPRRRTVNAPLRISRFDRHSHGVLLLGNWSLRRI